MINRELIRIKVVQLVYSYYLNNDRDIDKAEKELLFSMSKAYDLYNYLLQLIVAIYREMEHRHEIAVNRAQREGKPLPSDKFVRNRFALQLADNDMLKEFCSHQKVMWENDIEFIIRLCNAIEHSDIYADYMASDDDSYEADREVWRKIYRTLIQENEALDSVLEEKSLYWNDDKEIIDTFVLKTIKRFEEANGAEQQLLPQYKDEEDQTFACRLFRTAIENDQTYHQYMNEMSDNWDLERMPFMDVIIMQIALAEMLTFETIPVSVTINVYVDIAKLYSTRKSGAYINGLLDAIARNLIEKRLLLKAMKD